MKIVSVLGSDYEIRTDVPEEGMPENADGTCDVTTKTILIAKIEIDRNSVKNIDSYIKKVIRHEIVHAFLYESGIAECSMDCNSWGSNEEMVDWFAIQAPKLIEAFKAADCL